LDFHQNLLHFQQRTVWFALSLLLFLPAAAGQVPNNLETLQGRSETRVFSAPYRFVTGTTVAGCGLLERLDQLGYRRVRDQPQHPGEFFYGHELFWIYRQAHRLGGTDYPPSLIGLALQRPDSTITGLIDINGKQFPLHPSSAPWLEPTLLAESLAADRADRVLIDLEQLPEHVWRPLLAMEDARFFDHSGVDGRALARAAIANIKKKGIAQGGSTLTQQLIKNRDLTPKRTLGRKASEAIRALMLEVNYTKEEILQAYLNQVYMGHAGGLAIHGYGAAARHYFSRPAEKLTLPQSALLAAIVQGPNRLSPLRHPEAAIKRRNLVLGRMEAEHWATTEEVKAAQNAPLGLTVQNPESRAPGYLLSWAAALADEHSGERLEEGRGVRVETTLDPWLQQQAEQVVATGLRGLRNKHRTLRGQGLSAALIALDAATGEVLAYVGGDPANPGDRFDRVRNGRRQPGSTVKPFVMLEALDECGDADPLKLSDRVVDRPLHIDLPSGTWSPENADRRYKGEVDVRTALAESRNVPMVRIARHCGMNAVAGRFLEAGLPAPSPAPPSMVLGSVETTPLELAEAYTVLATLGRALQPFPVRRMESPGGRTLATWDRSSRKVSRPGSAWLVRDTLRSAVETGTAAIGALEGVEVAAKTGSSSNLRDSWFAGMAGSVLTVVWVGRDSGEPLGLSGSRGAGPVWKAFMETAVATRPTALPGRPRGVVERFVDTKTGLMVRERNPRARKEYFRFSQIPRRDRFFRRDRKVPVIQ
jgi:penicillin-binding protein 1B